MNKFLDLISLIKLTFHKNSLKSLKAALSAILVFNIKKMHFYTIKEKTNYGSMILHVQTYLN